MKKYAIIAKEEKINNIVNNTKETEQQEYAGGVNHLFYFGRVKILSALHISSDPDFFRHRLFLFPFYLIFILFNISPPSSSAWKPHYLRKFSSMITYYTFCLIIFQFCVVYLYSSLTFFPLI